MVCGIEFKICYQTGDCEPTSDVRSRCRPVVPRDPLAAWLSGRAGGLRHAELVALRIGERSPRRRPLLAFVQELGPARLEARSRGIQVVSANARPENDRYMSGTKRIRPISDCQSRYREYAHRAEDPMTPGLSHPSLK